MLAFPRTKAEKNQLLSRPKIEMCRQLAQADGVAIDPRHIYHRPWHFWCFGQEATIFHADGGQY